MIHRTAVGYPDRQVSTHDDAQDDATGNAIRDELGSGCVRFGSVIPPA
jgi:hypothetical protein